jgi:hypothetical protein
MTGGGQMVCRQVWVPNVINEEVSEVVSQQQTAEVQYLVYEQHYSTVPHECVCIEYRPENRTGTKKEVVYEMETRTRPRTIVEYVNESRTRNKKVLTFNPGGKGHAYVKRLFIDKKSMLYLQGAQVDFHEDLNARGFRITNPQAKGTCGCGSSFSM